MEPEQHHGFPTDDERPTAQAYLGIELITTNHGKRFRRGQARSLLGLFTSLIRQLLSKARS